MAELPPVEEEKVEPAPQPEPEEEKPEEVAATATEVAPVDESSPLPSEEATPGVAMQEPAPLPLDGEDSGSLFAMLNMSSESDPLATPSEYLALQYSHSSSCLTSS